MIELFMPCAWPKICENMALHLDNGKRNWVDLGTCLVLCATSSSPIFCKFGTGPKCSLAVDVQDGCLDTVVHKEIFMLGSAQTAI